MRTWLSLPFLPTDRLQELIVVAEGCGVAGVSLTDHLCVPPEIASEYPYSVDGTAYLPPDSQFPDPLIVAAALGASTTSIRFMTGVLVAPLRHPLLLAKGVATTAALTNGRFDLGVGVGWMREEFAAVGVPFSERGTRLDETLEILRLAWTGELVGYEGVHFSFLPVAINPRPPEEVRVLVGGYSQRALQRTVRFGDGWVGANPTPEELADILPRLRAALQVAGRDVEGFEIRTGFRGRITEERVATLRNLGVTDVLLAPWQVANGGSVHDLSADALLDALPRSFERWRAARKRLAAQRDEPALGSSRKQRARSRLQPGNG